MTKKRAAVVPLTLALIPAAIAACGGVATPANCPGPLGQTTSSASASSSSSATPPTPDDARAFLAGVDAELRRLTVAQARAEWVYETYVMDDAAAVSGTAGEQLGAYTTKTTLDARRFDSIAATLPPDLARQLKLLKLAQTSPAPTDGKDGAELAQLMTKMPGIYAKGQYCPPRLKGKCLHLDQLEHLRADATGYDQLLEDWTGWHEVAKPMRDLFTRYVELGNKGARDIGFADMGALWRSSYDMSPEDFEKETERLWQQVKPLYDDLHCYARAKLRKEYGAAKVPVHAPIPAHLLGNMWAQQWTDIGDLLEPYHGEPPLDATPQIKQKKLSPVDMVKLGEKFFVSLGFDPLPDTFWQRSLFERPRDRDVVCHASAWDVQSNGDLRIKMCIEPSETDLITIHHELGHDFYFQSYFKLPILFQQGANDGFHEGIGDTLALSVTPDYLKSIGLLDALPKGDRGRINVQMKMAAEKIAFLPFGLLVDKWRWDVFSGKTKKGDYNAAWWALRAQYQGVAPDKPRGEEYFDPGAKYHVATATPYMRYFLAVIYQFQFHRALCKAAGFTGPIDKCSIYGNTAAGAKLKAMLSLGASKPWQDALEALSGERQADASAILDYFAPLKTWLEDQNKGEQCGW